MTDMRATERLLEVIEEHAEFALSTGSGIAFSPDQLLVASKAIVEAITELRRRGDTIVQARDLEEVIGLARDHYAGSFIAVSDVIDRLENALGGRMR